ncbi:hypothetical protein Tco_0128770 [Tanacetum coccineum]
MDSTPLCQTAIADPYIHYLKMKNGIRKKYLINVSLGKCKRAKQMAIFDYEGGLREHYRRFWEYRQAILDSNLGSTCRLDDEETESEDLHLQNGEGLTIISDSHKGLLEGVNELLLNAEHRKCTRHLFANYKKKYSEVQLQCLFWNAASTTVEQLFYSKMEELKIISPEAYQYLIDKNPNSWCRAFFRQESKCQICEDHKSRLDESKWVVCDLENETFSDRRLYFLCVDDKLKSLEGSGKTYLHKGSLCKWACV